MVYCSMKQKTDKNSQTPFTVLLKIVLLLKKRRLKSKTFSFPFMLGVSIQRIDYLKGKI